MRNKLRFFITLTMCVLMACGVFTSCDDDDYYWGTPGGSSYYDRDLVGTWQLVQINGITIPPADANYFSFFGRGSGTYYYHEGGREFAEDISYWSTDTYYNSYLTINYATGRESTMNYWFTEDYQSLWMQWQTNSGTMTYRYILVSGVPW